jgi:dCMP deaminase
MKEKFKKAYMETAKIFAELSHARRLHVGAIVVKDDRIISIGYNGMPAGWDNNCETKQYMDHDAGGWLNPDEIEERWPHTEETLEQFSDDTVYKKTSRYNYKTRPEVLHAESNAIAKLAKSNDSGEGADIFITHSPCIECAKLIYQSGIQRVFYGQDYRDDSGIEFLKKSGVEIEKLDT